MFTGSFFPHERQPQWCTLDCRVSGWMETGRVRSCLLVKVGRMDPGVQTAVAIVVQGVMEGFRETVCVIAAAAMLWMGMHRAGPCCPRPGGRECSESWDRSVDCMGSWERPGGERLRRKSARFRCSLAVRSLRGWKMTGRTGMSW